MLTSLFTGLLATTNFQSFSTDSSNLGTTLFFAAVYGFLIALVFALAAGALGQRKILAVIEGLVIGVIATVTIAGFTTFTQGQGAVANNMITGTFGAVATLTPAASAGMTQATLDQWLN